MSNGKMKDFAVEYEGDDIVAYNKLLFETFPQTLFDPAYLLSSALLTKDNQPQQGRGEVHRFAYNNLDLVLRHYHRGGFPAKFIQDKYLWSGMENSRAMQELEMLSTMDNLGLPVPKPAAARICKKGLTYQADIVTVLIADAETLSATLMHQQLSDLNWQHIGEVIKNFHQHNCNHADLNAHNIMLNQKQGVYLIDFDKSNFDSSSSAWKMKNLQRLKRSLEKLAKENNSFNYKAENFSSIMQGYAE